MDLKSMTATDLRKLRDDVEAAIVDRQRQDRVAAKAAAEAAAAEFGFTLGELMGDQKKTSKPKAAAKYRNPENTSQTWSGRGRKPLWLVTALEAGADIAELEI